MNPNHPVPSQFVATGVAVVAIAVLLMPLSLHAQGKKKNPTSKVFISDVSGEGEIDIGESIQDLTKKSVYNAQGTIIQTKKADRDEDKNKIFSTAVYSNGTGAYYDQDTKVEMKKFAQEPFTPNRVDMDTEPSISQTQAFVARGAVGLCNSKQVAGSSMNYSTAHGSVNIRGKKVVIQANDKETKISMLEGDSTVRGGDMDMGGQTLRSGQQAIIRPGRAGAPNQVQIQNIPPAEMASLDDKVAQACMAKKTVYFEVREKKNDGSESTADAQTAAADSTTANSEASPGAAPPISAFDGNSITNTSSVSVGEIVAIPTVPKDLPSPVLVISPSTLTAPRPPGSG